LADDLLIKHLSISIGGHFGPSYSVELKEGVLTYAYSKPVRNFPSEWDSGSKEIRPSREQWQAFRSALDQLNVWCWQQDYPNPGVCDGTGWSVEIAYSDKSILSGGSNCFPDPTAAPISITRAKRVDTFDRFCQAVSARWTRSSSSPS
jgi:hypothetical protein